MANDDTGDTDEMPPNSAGRMYVSDSPGFDAYNVQPIVDAISAQSNFKEFVRVSFSRNTVFRNGLQGSRASDLYLWSSRSLIVRSGNGWVRSTGDAQETADNLIGPGHHVIQIP